MEQQHHEQHSIRLKRAAAASASISGGSGGTPAGLSPTAAASPVATTRGGGGPTATSGRLRQPLQFTFDFREPDQMEEPRAQRLQRKFRERMGAKCAKYELVAGFHLEDGVILSYHRFRTRIHFELTERRRKILCRYYRQGQQEVLLYVDRSEFEYYSPVCCYQPPPQRQQQRPASDGRGGGGGGGGKGSSATSCFAISGCAS